MKLLIQRVKQASVTIDEQTIGQIDSGLLLFLGIHRDDTEKDIDYLVNKVVNLRLFPSEKSGFDHSALELEKEILVVSQFTLYGDCKKGRRPDFNDVAKPEQAVALYEQFIQKIKETGLKIATGQFQAHMEVKLVNDGPVTLFLTSDKSD